MGITAEGVASIPVFSKLPAETLTLVRRAVVERTFPPGHLIFVEGEQSRGLWFLKEGRVKIFRMSREGREQGLCLMRPGMCCGCPLFYGELNPASAEAVDMVTLYFIDRTVALDLADRSPDFGRALFGVFARGEQILSSLVARLSCSHLAGRLAHFLLEQSERQPPRTQGQSPRSLGLSHQQVASLLGTSRETVTRGLAKLEDAGVIELGRKRITILDARRLRGIAW